MQRALVVLDDIFYCSVGNGLDRSLQIGQGFCPLFILYKYKTKITARRNVIFQTDERLSKFVLSFRVLLFRYPATLLRWLMGSMMACTTKRWLLEA